MADVLKGLEPSNVYDYFEKICSIPHGSGNTKEISDYIASEGKRLGLDTYQDEAGNVIIRKAATPGYEDADIVVMQGHMDMVCEKTEDCDIDFKTDGLQLEVKDGVVSAKGTTLGGDDGIAVAYMLAILSSDEYKHPALECVFTVDEEIGMLGAVALDMSQIKGKMLINVDSEEEGILTASCAGGIITELKVPYTREVPGKKKEAYSISISGLTGGHSGSEIHKGYINADKLMGDILYELIQEDKSLRLVDINGGLMDNAIPVACNATVVSGDISTSLDILKEIIFEFTNEYKEIEPNMLIMYDMAVSEGSEGDMEVFDKKSTLNVINALKEVPNGVIKYSESMEGMVQTSLNLGKLVTDEADVRMVFLIRSSVNDEKQELVDELKQLADKYEGSLETSSPYPAWEYKEESKLRPVMTSIFEEMFGHPMIVQSIHAGLECGIFCGGIEGLDAVSLGPNLFDIHTPRERMYIDSVQRTWDYLLRVLESLK